MTIREAFGKLAVATAKGMKNPFFVIRNLHKEFKDIQDNVTSCGLVQDAKDIDYDNTNSGLTAENAQVAIDELAEAVDDADTEIATIDGRVDTLEGKVDRGSVSVTADGVKTAGALLDELYALIDFSKVTLDVKLQLGNYMCVSSRNSTNECRFVYTGISTNICIILNLFLISTGSVFRKCEITSSSVSITNETNDVPDNGTVYTLYY